MLLWDVLCDANTSLTLQKHGGFLQSHCHLSALLWHRITLGSDCPLSLERCWNGPAGSNQGGELLAQLQRLLFMQCLCAGWGQVNICPSVHPSQPSVLAVLQCIWTLTCPAQHLWSQKPRVGPWSSVVRLFS